MSLILLVYLILCKRDFFANMTKNVTFFSEDSDSLLSGKLEKQEPLPLIDKMKNLFLLIFEPAVCDGCIRIMFKKRRDCLVPVYRIPRKPADCKLAVQDIFH